MVVLRSSLELHSRSTASATDSLDLSNEFLSLEQMGRRRLRSAGAAEKSAVTAAATDDGSSVKEVETYHRTRTLKSLRKNAQTSSDSSFDKNMEITEKHANGRHFTRRRHAIHSSDSTSSSSSEDEQHFERRRKRSRNRAINRCLPLNFRKDELRGIYKDRMKIGASLADVDPMQLDSSVRFDSVGGLSKHIAALKEMVVFPLLYPEVFEKFKIQPPRGCLFYGPPGTGKTLVARALANECSQGDKRVAFFMRKGADCLSKWVGESERQLRLLFDQAYQMRPSIIFFDEIDGLAPVRSSRQDQIHSSIVSTLLALMDGLDSRGEIVVIGATNRLDSIDPALRRPGRFDREFLFSLPDKEVQELFIHDYGEIFNVQLPGKEERTAFFEDLILKQAAKLPISKKKADRLIRHRACALRDTAYAIIKEELDEDFEQLCEEIQESRKKRGCSSSKYAPSYYHVMPKQNSTLAGDKRSDLEQNEKVKTSSIPVACSTPAQLKRKIRKKSKWYLGTITKRRKISQAKDDNQNAADDKIESDTEETQDTSVDHNETGNTGESSIEENEKQQSASESKRELGNNNSSTYNIEKELEDSRNATPCTELRKDKIVCNGDPSNSQIIGISDENEGKEMCVLRMTRARRSQVEQQQLISVEKALAILSQPTPTLVVDHERLKTLLKTVVKKSQEYNILQLENLYAVISQCIYQHRRDYDKTTLIQVKY
ncbi:ATPase family AAA domain-containing protein 2 [Sciurus carolinensis]|uniref:ATPase family AAA domain-containing protein 2 n=1 Tax=Sciurus carolinensis TaxID=30640 RepID=A0AA41N808_SCICA|nr:ATPase family AAA domain-containing protein 2 [Sciurus carolinensis]